MTTETPEERRAAQIKALRAGTSAEDDIEAFRAYVRLLRHFEETGQGDLAKAIRCGIEEVVPPHVPLWNTKGELLYDPADDIPFVLYRIKDKP